MAKGILKSLVERTVITKLASQESPLALLRSPILDSSSPSTSTISDDFSSSECPPVGSELEDESILALTQNFSNLMSSSMSTSAADKPVVMDTPFNHPPSVDPFYGTGDIKNWLKKLRRAQRPYPGDG
ncbi:hypothetical protein E4U59_001806 [Claviceps monticola]|nr:hypothetical protein E4U59_001806 [Claviceps monticola]